VLRFGRFAVDLDAAEIRSSEGVVPVEPQVFDLVALLCTNPGRLISHDEIIEKVWRGRIVSDSAIATRINAARKALGDDGSAQRIIKTVRGRGFRFELVPLHGKATTSGDGRPVSAGDERFVLSCTPHAFSLLMKTRSGDVRQDWRSALPPLFAEVMNKSNGKAEAASLAVFQSGVDALNCAHALLKAIREHCSRLPAAERWTVKIGIGYGTSSHGFAHALAARFDTLAHPGGVCVAKRVKDAAEGIIDIDAVAVGESEAEDPGCAFRVTRIRDLTLARSRKIQLAHTLNLELPEPSGISLLIIPFEVVGQEQ
jgi:DNA-binding winged helix-turn-helix (wHTH) protein